MYAANQNNINYNVDLEDIKKYLEKIVELISRPPKYVLNKITNKTKNQDETDEKEFEYYMNLLNQKIELLSDALYKSKFFYDEYYDLCEIKDLFKYTLNRDLSTIKYSDLEFIIKLFKDFFEILDYKLTLLENNKFDEKLFESKYEIYLSTFNKSKTYFYNEIYDETMDDSLFVEFCNLIQE